MAHDNDDNDRRYTTTNYLAQCMSPGHGKSFDMWRHVIKKYGFNDEIVLHVMDIKASGEFTLLLEELYGGADSERSTPKLDELMRLGQKSEVMTTRDPKDYVQYPTLEAYTAAHGLDKPVATDDEE